MISPFVKVLAVVIIATAAVSARERLLNIGTLSIQVFSEGFLAWI